MFGQFFVSMQQDLQLCVYFPVVCAVFRAVFIKVYTPYQSFKGRWRVIFHCFRFGFWWGMDFNAYAFLLPLVLVSLPGLWIASYYAAGDTVRLIAGMVYATVLYAAFAGKMIFYNHFHDTYNYILRMGGKAEKRNLIDTFFNQDHGAKWLLGLIPFWGISYGAITMLLGLPNIPYPQFESDIAAYVFNTVTVVVIILGFYWFRYGGNIRHEDKPEWDTMPSMVKQDTFFAKAAVDDLVALEQVKRHKLNALYTHTDEEDLASIAKIIPDTDRNMREYPNPVYAFMRRAKGAKIKKPGHIFLIVGESYLQQFFDPAFACLNITSGGKRLMEDPHTVTLQHSLSSGVISRPTIVGLMSGLFDLELQLNEKEPWWGGTVPTALPLQLKKLGYSSTYWYGGNATYGNFTKFAPACGFDSVMSATDFCDPHAPKTWVGVYDNVYLEKAAELIQARDSGKPEFHMVYTTSYHSPFKIDVEKYGYAAEKVMPDAPEDIKKDKKLQRILGTFWFTDQAIGRFVDTIRKAYPDALIFLTADHAIPLTYMEKTSLMMRHCSIRELHCPTFMMHHPDIDASVFAGNTIGSHMNIMPTIMELIAPEGFAYYSLFPSLTEPVDHVVSPHHWLRPDAYGTYDSRFYQPLGKEYAEGDVKEGAVPYEEERRGYMDLTGYMMRHPELLEPADSLLRK